jgi:Ni2+-binding GTPase involved in maturation of urease and hydrogenase
MKKSRKRLSLKSGRGRLVKRKTKTQNRLKPATALSPDDIEKYHRKKGGGCDALKYLGVNEQDKSIAERTRRTDGMCHGRDINSNETEVERLQKRKDYTDNNLGGSRGGNDKKPTNMTYDGLDVECVPKMGDFKVTNYMKDNIFPKHPYRLLIVGPSGAGKSNLLLWLCLHQSERGYFDRTYLLGHSCKTDPGFKRLVDNGVVKKKDIYTTNLHDNLDNIVNRRASQVESKDLGKFDKSLKPERIIIEDITSNTDIIRSKTLIYLLTASRHLNISVIIVGHKLSCIVRVARMNATDIIFFPSPQTDVDVLREEFGPPHMNRKVFAKVVEYATKRQHDKERPFLRVALDVPFSTRYRRCWDTIIDIDKMREDE